MKKKSTVVKAVPAASAAPKPAAASQKDARRRVVPKLQADIEYPLEGERVQPGHYAVRIAAGGATEVEISVADGPWQPCRESVGYHWFDWAPAGSGRSALTARARSGKGRWIKTEVRACQVAPVESI